MKTVKFFFLFIDEIILKSQQRFKSDHHNVNAEEINKMLLSINNNKRLKHLIKLLRIHTEQIKLKCVKVNS